MFHLDGHLALRFAGLHAAGGLSQMAPGVRSSENGPVEVTSQKDVVFSTY